MRTQADPEPKIDALIRESRVLVTVGAGGVGKTTSAAAIAVRAACQGRRVLCLTVDPAKRLAESLGLREMSTEETTVDTGRFTEAGIECKGSLTVMMLDTKQTFDTLVKRTASSPAAAERIFNNRLYKYLSGSLAGTQEYMAMEKLTTVRHDPRFDLVVLDTPPTANALDFLDAPERLVNALDSAAIRWILSAFSTSGKFSLNLVAKSAQIVLQTVGKITGGRFLEELSKLVVDLSDLFKGFRERALSVQSELRAKDVAFLLVSSAQPMSLKEILYFADRLDEAKLRRAGFIVNRVRTLPSVEVDAMNVGLPREIEGIDRAKISRAWSEENELARADQDSMRVLESKRARGETVYQVPESPVGVSDLKLLVWLGNQLAH